VIVKEENRSQYDFSDGFGQDRLYHSPRRSKFLTPL
jgi:hypothetical protein